MTSLSELEQRICRLIENRSAEMLRDLAAHVAIPTGHNFRPGLDQYRDVVTDRLAKLGGVVELVAGDSRPGWLELPGTSTGEASIPPVAIVRAPHVQSNKPRILIAGHLDTVHDPQGEFRELSIAPDGKTCIGPGAVDMKGGILVGLVALETLAACGVNINWTFLLNSDEETGSFHSYRAIFETARQHDIGIALEPAMPDGGLVVSRMGSGQFRIEAFGRGAHVGRDFARGVSAVNALAQVILDVAKLAQPERGTIVNVGPLQGGSVTNAVPDYAACWGNVRFTDTVSAQRLQKSFEAIRRDGLPRIDVQHAFNRPAKPPTPHVQALAEAAREVAVNLGQVLPFGSTGGVCDGNIMHEAGLRTIDTMGVRGGNLHRKDEYVEIPSLVQRAQLLSIFLLRQGSGSRIHPL